MLSSIRNTSQFRSRLETFKSCWCTSTSKFLNQNFLCLVCSLPQLLAELCFAIIQLLERWQRCSGSQSFRQKFVWRYGGAPSSKSIQQHVHRLLVEERMRKSLGMAHIHLTFHYQGFLLVLRQRSEHSIISRSLLILCRPRHFLSICRPRRANGGKPESPRAYLNSHDALLLVNKEARIIYLENYTRVMHDDVYKGFYISFNLDTLVLDDSACENVHALIKRFPDDMAKIQRRWNPVDLLSP